MYHPTRGLIMESIMIANIMFVVITNILIAYLACFNAYDKETSEIWLKRYMHWAIKALLHNKKMHKHQRNSQVVCNGNNIEKLYQRETGEPQSNYNSFTVIFSIPSHPHLMEKKRYLLNFIDDFGRKL